MKFYRICGAVLLLFCSQLQAQENSGKTSASRIMRLNVSSSPFAPLEMKDALYDTEKNHLPFYTLTYNTDPATSATAKLTVKNTRLLNAEEAAVVTKHFGKYLTGDFVTVRTGGISRGKNLNVHRLYPLRINKNGAVEELLEYEVRWTTTQSISYSTARRASSTFTSNSVLQSGTWYKIGVTKSGIHRIGRNFFNAMGINASKLDPRMIRIYGNGGKMLPELNKAPRIDDLHENPILVVGGADGSFDNSDYVLFYASGPTEWKRDSVTKFKFQAVKNLYSDTSFYFINVDLGEGRRIGSRSPGSGANVSTTTYDYYNYHEEDLVSPAKSGRQLLGESFDFVNFYNFRWDDGNFVTNDTLFVQTSLAANYVNSSLFTVTGNGVSMALNPGPVSKGSYPDYAVWAVNSATALNNNATAISITVEKKTSQAAGWLDKVTVNARRRLVAGARQFQFRDSRVSKPGNVCQYNISTSGTQGLQVWNVTNPVEPYIQNFTTQSNILSFAASADSLNEYCIAPSGDFFTPAYVGKVENQNLHALTQADYIIVTHPLFINEAGRLGAFHQQQEGYSYCVVTIDQIYNEFSSGRPDVSAIRDFIRMLYTRNENTGSQVRFVCLMGDGSYNNKSRNIVNNSNFILTYQSINSLSQINSVATDDFFGMMDPDEGVQAENYGLVDIGIGRFTCRSVNEVRAVLNKVEHYYSNEPNFKIEETIPISHNSSQSPLGDWRTWLLFLADDMDGATHMWQSDTLALLVKVISPGYNNDKIMLDAYQRFSTPGGNRYPDASEDFLRRLRKGALIFNYTGHGGEVGLTAERMVDIEMINNLDNFNQLPLFITATCEFSRYDDPARTSAGELSLLNPKGGAIALMTTARLAFSNSNLTLNKILIKKIFRPLPDGSLPALGDIIQQTKTDLNSQAFYYANFHLLGDPALRLAYPHYNVITTKINGANVSSGSSDSLKALGKITVEGIVTDAAGKKLDFNGIVYPTVFDKEQVVQGLLNDPESGVGYDPRTGNDPVPFEFNLQKNILYRGKAVVKNGNFSFTFLVPRDISFSYGQGKITYYATTGKHDAMGYYKNLVVGGESGNAIADDDGPQIDLFLNDKNFVSGGVTDETPILYADLIDSSGINTSGVGLGHDLSAILDEKSDKPIILNDYYEANLNSYQSGRVRYPFSELKEGPHTLTFKVWDVQNNSSVVALDFVVAKRAELALKQVLNYPNPFTTKTKFFFQHNQSGVPLRVHIQVYTVSGKMVKTIQQTVVSQSFLSEGIEWDGRDEYGDKLARGVYIYKLAILDINNSKAEKIEKLVILN